MQKASSGVKTALQEAPVLFQVKQLMDSPVSLDIEKKRMEFRTAGKGSKESLFGELCFCLLTANTSAEMGVRTQQMIGIDGFLNYDETKLRDELKRVKYRFYNLRSKFIVESRWIVDKLPSLVNASDTYESREFLVQNILGLGYKEASHFLRNVGVFDFAILDKHILGMLGTENPELEIKATSRKKYLNTEEIILDMARNINLEPGILDLYMWKIATGKIIK
jgi:N-glycosylase/DNA lyase